jgi:penicillin amidase
MRMVLDLDEWDNSVWQNLTGTSGHTFHLNYVDQTDDWAQGAQFSWRYSAETIEEAAVDTLVLQPGDST